MKIKLEDLVIDITHYEEFTNIEEDIKNFNNHEEMMSESVGKFKVNVLQNLPNGKSEYLKDIASLEYANFYNTDVFPLRERLYQYSSDCWTAISNALLNEEFLARLKSDDAFYISSVIYIEKFSVNESYRGLGIGQLLLSLFLKYHSIRRGIGSTLIFLTTWNLDKGKQATVADIERINNFYSKCDVYPIVQSEETHSIIFCKSITDYKDEILCNVPTKIIKGDFEDFSIFSTDLKGVFE